jgi:cell pole-organizing protein PopZ
MSDPRSANNDPSMDDILASIRKIISDDEARAQVNSQQAAHQSGRKVDPRR